MKKVHTQKIQSKSKPVKPHSVMTTFSYPFPKSCTSHSAKPLVETGYSTLGYQYI